jgi:16S rRNA (cytosine967-C5)-methyltransferase
LTPGAQVSAALDILGAIEAGDRPAEDCAADYFRRRRYIGAKDRANIAGHVYAVLRHRARLDWWIARQGAGPGPRTRMLAELLLIAGWRPEAVAASFDGDRFRPAPLDRVEMRLVPSLDGRTLSHPEMPRWVANDLPEWLEPYFASVFGKEFERELAALNRPAPMDLRVNLLKFGRDDARRALLREGIAAEPTPWSPIGLRLPQRAPLAGTAAFKDGLVEVQDEAGQLAALLVGARPGMRVVDFCAGAGGKSLALAAAMQNRGRLVAADISAKRLERAAPRLRRAGVQIAERRVLAREHDPWVKHHKQSFDRVLVDAPCLGTGTWRRNPAEKWRVTPAQLAELLPRQQQILREAARLVRSGGRLVYATCSLLVDENEAQAEAFLGAMPDFAAVPAPEAWAETIGGLSPSRDRFLRLTPARHGTDGFFIAIFERRPNSPSPRERGEGRGEGQADREDGAP